MDQRNIKEFEITNEQITELNISKKITESYNKLPSDHIFMWETDLKGLINNHIIVFG